MVEVTSADSAADGVGMILPRNVGPTPEGYEIASRVERFVRETIIPFEGDKRWGRHGPSETMLAEMRALARSADILSPHLRSDGHHLSHRDTAMVLRAAGASPLGPLALNVAAPDEGNMYLLSRTATEEQKKLFLAPLVAGIVRSAFFMTEPAADNGAGSDPSMLQTIAEREGDYWVINGRKAFTTGAQGARVGILMAKTGDGTTMFLVELPNPAITIVRIPQTLDSTMPGGHPESRIANLRVDASCILGEVGAGLGYAQLRLAPARLTHCSRWLGACLRAQDIAAEYATRRRAFGKVLIDHEGVGFMLAENLIDLKQSELIINWCADVLDAGALGTSESSMTKVAVSEALFRVADRCMQIMGATGIARDTIVEQVFRETRAFRIYDGPTEVHKWSLAKRVKRETLARLKG